MQKQDLLVHRTHLYNCRFSTSGLTHQRDTLSAVYRQLQFVEDFSVWSGRVGELCVINAYVALDLASLESRGRVGVNEGFPIQQKEHSPRSNHRLVDVPSESEGIANHTGSSNDGLSDTEIF